jgi:rhodanese-related sulfurtransferase
MKDQILPFLDFEIAKKVEQYLSSKKVKIVLKDSVTEFIKDENSNVKEVLLSSGKKIETDFVIVAIGVKPNSLLAKEAGLTIGSFGGIKVNEYMQTSDENIYAAGDCIETVNLINNTPFYWPMGDAANLQGRVAGQNVIVGNKECYKGAIATGICKVFEYTVGSVGLSEVKAKENKDYDVETVIHAAPDKPGFMGALLIIIKLVYDKKSDRLLGVQMIGPGDVSKRLATAAMAIHNNMKLKDMLNLDLPYAPPFSPAIDNFICAIHILENKVLDRMKSVNPMYLKEKLENKEDFFLLDVRGFDEFEMMKMDKGETVIPLGALRNSLDKLPQDKNKEIIVYCKISLRGYEAYSYLTSIGYTNVKVLEGGLLTYAL